MSKTTKAKKLKKLNRHPKGNKNLKNSEGNIIDVRKLSKYYVSGHNAVRILKDISLSIPKGKLIVIYGPSGSGKSTFLNVISGLDRATTGDVIVNDVNLSALKDPEMTQFRRDNVGFVFQSYNLLPDLNARDNVKIGQVLQKDPQKALDVEDLFNDLGIKEVLNQDIRNLSGGQQQRVSVARALSKNPTIIFADEPTGSLDQKTTLKVIRLLASINKKYGTTIIVVTHDEQ
ncbi:uncharacterized protein LOC111616975 [Centruroides sculpturatus]|uniref:uncharacterized protein LOC111616971 n=1 Tax=Centruroides sculpturatus TaxID=218467 RepID=UPI000C6CBCF9|nr:uncharacterized protein LOC111616971 [Centruroides sculpturatus]XP_023214093.1 uncharacterized protein LOC111616975 [Centruroides sculpturatus]